MRISELSRRSEVPIATIKYYIREGLLPAGRPVAANQADYDEDHLRRLRLVRALVAVRGLPVSTAAEVLAVLGDGRGESVHHTLGRVLGVMDTARAGERAASEAGLSEVRRLVTAMGWHIHPGSAAVDALARALDALGRLGMRFDSCALLSYARLAERTAEVDLDLLDAPAGGDPAEHAVLLAVLLEPALLVLRRMAQEHHTGTRPAGTAQPGGGPAAGPGSPLVL